jgi:hypothetical protein
MEMESDRIENLSFFLIFLDDVERLAVLTPKLSEFPFLGAEFVAGNDFFCGNLKEFRSKGSVWLKT